MIQRNSQRAQAPMKGAPSLITQGLGRIGPQSQQGMFDTHVATPDVVPVADSQRGASPLLGQVLGALGQLTDDAIQRSRQTAYLEGAAAAGVGESVKSLNNNILTRAWAVAGHRDTTGSIALSEYETGIARAMPRLREQGPEAVQQYLKQARNTVMGTVGAMTAEGREKALNQLLMLDRKALATHNVEHSKFVVEQKEAAKTTAMSVGIDGLNAAMGTPAYESARDSFFTTMVNEIFFDPSLPTETKNKLAVEVLSAAMRDGHLGMYELARQYPVLSDGMGGHLSLTQLMGFDDQETLSKEYRSSRSYHENAIGKEMWDTLTSMETAVLMGQHVPSDVYSAHLRDMVDARLISLADKSSREKKMAVSQREASHVGDGAVAYMKGDYSTMAKFGITGSKGPLAAEKLWFMHDENLSTEEIVNRHIATGVRTGNPHAFTRAGELVQPALTAIMGTDFTNMNPEQVALVQNVRDAFIATESRPELQVHMLKSMTPDQQVFLSNINYFMTGEGGGYPTEDAVKKARDQYIHHESLSNPAKRELARRQQTEDDEIARKAAEPQGFFQKAINVLTFGVFEGAELGQVAPSKGNPTVVAHEAQIVQNEVGKELDAFNRSSQPFADARAKQTAAVAAVAKRTITVPAMEGGQQTNLILPRGTNYKEIFFTPDQLANAANSYGPEHIGVALAQMTHQEGFDAHLRYENGEIRVDYYNRRGDSTPTDSTLIDPLRVGAAAMDVRETIGVENAVHVYGEGKRVGGPNGAEVRFNGANTAGIDPEVAFYVRDTLVQVEGVHNTPYEDGAGYSVGVGINTGNPQFYPDVKSGGVIDNATITESFRGVSDYMMGKAQHYVNESGIVTDAPEALLALTTHMYYQTSPKTFVQDISPIYEAIHNQDLNAAMDALEKSRAYIGAKPHSERGRMYRQWLQDLIKPRYR